MNTAVPFQTKNAVTKLPTLIAMGCGSRSSIYQSIADGTFPPAIRLSRRNAVWPLDEVERVLGARIRGASEDQLKALTAEIVEARKHRT